MYKPPSIFLQFSFSLSRKRKRTGCTTRRWKERQTRGCYRKIHTSLEVRERKSGRKKAKRERERERERERDDENRQNTLKRDNLHIININIDFDNEVGTQETFFSVQTQEREQMDLFSFWFNLLCVYYIPKTKDISLVLIQFEGKRDEQRIKRHRK